MSRELMLGLKAKKDEEKPLTIKQDAKGVFLCGSVTIFIIFVIITAIINEIRSIIIVTSITTITTTAGIVFVQGATIQECASLDELIRHQVTIGVQWFAFDL